MNEVREAVEHLGTLSTRKIAKLFRETGVKGTPHDSRKCPVAVHLKAVTGVPVKAFPVSGVWTITGHYICDTPRSVQDFMCAFDSRKYKELM